MRFLEADRIVRKMAEDKALLVSCPICASPTGIQCASHNGRAHITRTRKSRRKL